MKLCVEGAIEKKDKGLSPIQRVFFYMPLQHAESRKVQKKSCEIYKRLSNAVSPTYKETFETVLHFAELHADIIEQFGRFPHRNKLLDRKNTPKEDRIPRGRRSGHSGKAIRRSCISVHGSFAAKAAPT